jgi:murein DD-endopeptidase MepM/ murein hydrolase activator NlpD
MAHAQVKLDIPIDPDFLAAMNKFMADVKRFQFQAQVQAFQRQQVLQALPPHRYGGIVGALNKISKTFEKMTQNLDRITDRLVNNAFGYLGKAFMRGIMAIMPSLETLMPLVGFLTGPVGAIISATTFIYSAARFGWNFMKWIYDKMIGLGEAVLKDTILSSGVGASVGGLRAFRAIFGGLGLPSEVFETAARGRGDPSSLAYGLLRNLGIKNTGDTADMLTELLLKGRKYMMQFPPDIRHKMAKSVGLEEWLGTELVYILPRLRDEEIQEMARQYREAKKVMQLTPEAIEGWKTFSITMRSIWPRIEKVIGELLADPKTGLLSKIKALSEAVTNFIKEALKSKLGDRVVEIVGGWIKNLTEYLSSDRPKKSLRDAKRAITGIVKQLDALSKRLRALLDFIGRGEPYVTIDRHGRITLHYRQGDRGVHPGRTMTPGAMRERQERTGVPRTRAGAGPPSAGPLPETYPVGPPGTRYDPISATSIGGGVGSDSASRGRHQHQGVDLMAPLGSPVYATMDGVIEKFGTDNFGQPTVTIRHADGTYTRYLHMHSRMGKVGDRVHGGQQIGTSGTANGVAHLHLERWFGPPNARNSRLLDPMREHGWERRQALPRGGQPARTNQNQPSPQTPPETRTPPDARRTQPAPTVRPTPDPTIPPVLQPQQRPPGYVPAVPPSGRRVVPIPRGRPVAPAPSTSATPRPTPAPAPAPAPSPAPAPAPSTTPTPRPAPPSGRRTAPAPAAPAPTPVQPGATRPAASGTTSLAEQRQRFATELQNNPALRERVLAISLGEQKGTDGNLAVFESAMNRASMMGTTLEFEMRRTNQRGYYAGYDPAALNNPELRRRAEENLQRALKGSNISNYATENASGDWGRRRFNGRTFTQVYESNGELFGVPTGPGARGYDRYQKWRSRTSAVTPPATPRVWGGEDIRRTLRPGAPGTPGGPAPVRPPPFETTPEALRPALPGTPGGPAPDRLVRPPVVTTDPSREVYQSPRGPWQDLPIVPEKKAGVVSKPGQSQSIVDLTNVDSRLRESLARAKTDFEAAHPGYTIQAYSGHRKSGGFHSSKSGAVDVYIVTPDGKRIPNEGGDTTGMYTEYARRTYGHVLKDHPELKDDYEWGGSFGTKRPSGGPPDLMHHDLGGSRGKSYPENNIRKLGPIMPDENSPSYKPPNSDANPPTTSGSPSVTSQPSNQSISPSASSQPSDLPVNRAGSRGLEPEQQYLPSSLKSSPSGEVPTALIFHNTENHLSPRKTAEIWAGETDPKRRGVGAQFIIDRDGTIHDVYKEYKYGGTDNIASDFTPQDLKDKGITNSRVVGIELVAKNDKDVTPAQIAAAKRLAKQYPHSRVASHSEVNPLYDPKMKGPHRKPGEGDRVADEIRKERAKDPDYIEPGSAGEYLKEHLKKFEEEEAKKKKEPVQADPEADRTNVAQLDTGTRSDAPTLIRFNPKTGEKEPDPDPRELQKAVEKVEPGSDLEWQLRTERALQQAGKGFSETETAHPPLNYGPGTGLPGPGQIQDELNRLGQSDLPGSGPELDATPRYMDPRDIGPDWKFNPYTGRPLEEPISYKPEGQLQLDSTKTKGGEGGDLGDIPPGSAAAFLQKHFKELSTEREAGDRSLAGYAQVAANKAKAVGKSDYEVSRDPEALQQPKESTIYYTGPKGPSTTYTNPMGQTYTDITQPVNYPSMSTYEPGKPFSPKTVFMPDYIPAVTFGNRLFPKGGVETRGDHWLVTIKDGPHAGESFVFRQTDTGPGAGAPGEKVDFTAPAVDMMVGLENKNKIPRVYLQHIKREDWDKVSEYVQPGRISPEDAAALAKDPRHKQFIENLKKIKENPRGGIGSDAAEQERINRREEITPGNEDRSRYLPENVRRAGGYQDDDTIREKEPEATPKRTRMPKIHKDHDVPVDVHSEHNNDSHAEHDASPSKEDESDATKGGMIESPA